MNHAGFLVHLGQMRSSYLVILILTLVALVAGFLLWIGLIGWTVAIVAAIVRQGIHNGFYVWQRLFSWASWTTFLGLMSTSVFVGWIAARSLPILTIVCALIPLFMGVTACLAYMLIDMERFAVARGYKSVHNPLRGQELAVNLVRYGQAVGVPLIVAASIGMIGGFALLNFGLYESIGRNWYQVTHGDEEPTYVDFVANALIVLLRIVDVLDFAKASHVLDVSYVRQSAWPSTTLLTVFRMFFTLVLLQQLFASVRQGQVLSETINDLWNPNEPIHERAFNALRQYGPGAVSPVLISLGNVTSLTKEQRERLPPMLSATGPAAIPSLLRHLTDEHDHVRAIAAASLGQLRVHGTVVMLVPLSQDSSDIVRHSLIEALGIIASTGSVSAESKPAVPRTKRRAWHSLKWRRPPVTLPLLDPVELAVKTLQSALSDDSLAVRAQAAHALGTIGPSAAVAAPNLIALLKDEDETVRRNAIESVGKVGGPTAAIVEALAKLLEDPSALLRATAAKELGAMRETAAAAFPALVPLLQDREDYVREAAAEAIGQIGQFGDETADELIEGLTNPDNVVRAQTAEALGAIGETAHESAEALVDALADRNDTVRAKAVEALGKIGELVADIAVPGLVRALRDQDNLVSSLAAAALGQMGDSADRAIPSLIRSLHHINPDVRASAAESLGNIGMDRAGTCDALERASHDDDADVRRQAIRALSAVDRPIFSTRQAVLAGLRDIDAQVRTDAVDALCRWGEIDESSQSLWLELLEDSNEQVRARVTKALPRLAAATPAIIEGLCLRLRDDTDLVQANAAQALGEFGSSAATAGAALLNAAQNGEANVRDQAIKAIKIIRPSESLTTFENNETETVLIEALREIEERTETESVAAEVDVIPVIVAPVIDLLTGQQIEMAMTFVGPIPADEAGTAFQEKIDEEKLAEDDGENVTPGS